MCKTNGRNGEEKRWFDMVNDIGRDIEVHARDEYDTFLEKCLEPYGINKLNAAKYTNRVRIEEESPHIDGYDTVTYQRFYIDGKYAFTVVFKQEPVNEGGFMTGMITTYEKVFEQDRIPKEKPMTNKEAIGYIKRIISGDSKPDIALNVIFSEEEIDRLCIGKPVKDEVNHITFMSEAAYDKHLKEKESDSEKW